VAASRCLLILHNRGSDTLGSRACGPAVSCPGDREALRSYASYLRPDCPYPRRVRVFLIRGHGQFVAAVRFGLSTTAAGAGSRSGSHYGYLRKPFSVWPLWRGDLDGIYFVLGRPARRVGARVFVSGPLSTGSLRGGASLAFHLGIHSLRPCRRDAVGVEQDLRGFFKCFQPFDQGGRSMRLLVVSFFGRRKPEFFLRGRMPQRTPSRPGRDCRCTPVGVQLDSGECPPCNAVARSASEVSAGQSPPPFASEAYELPRWAARRRRATR